VAMEYSQNIKAFRSETNETYNFRNENISLHGSVKQFFLLHLGLPFFHYALPLKYILRHDSLEPERTNKKNTPKFVVRFTKFAQIYHGTHTDHLHVLFLT
jgi:hypothetical protein